MSFQCHVLQTLASLNNSDELPTRIACLMEHQVMNQRRPNDTESVLSLCSPEYHGSWDSLKHKHFVVYLHAQRPALKQAVGECKEASVFPSSQVDKTDE